MQQSPLLKYFAPRSGHIAFIGIDGNIDIADQSGSVVHVTKDGQVGSSATVTYGAPTWSFDGKQIVFTRYKTDPSTKSERVTVMVADVSGKHMRKLFSSTSIAPFYFCWSPNDREIGMLSQMLDAQGEIEMGILRLSPRDRSASYHVLSSNAPFYWVWTPNSRSIVAHTQTSSAQNAPDFVRVFSANAKAGSYEQLKAYLGAFDTPAVSDGGKEVVIPIGSADASDLFLRNLRTGRERMVAKALGSVSYDLSPNGKWLAYLDQANAKGPAARTLHVVDMSDPARSFTVKQYPVFAFYWSPNSREIAYVVPPQSKLSVDSMFASSNRIPYAQLEVTDVMKKDSWSITQFPVTRGFLDSIPFNDQYQHSETIWSPDSNYLVFSAYAAQGKPGIFVAAANGDIKPDRIALGEYPAWSWR